MTTADHPRAGGSPSGARAAPSRRLPSTAVVVAAVDVGAPASRARSRVVLEVAAALGTGRSESAALHVVYGWSLVGESILACPLRGVSPERLRTLFARIGRQQRERVADFCAEVLPWRPDGIHVPRGDPRNVIPAVARRLGADLLVMGGSVGGGFGRSILGGVARFVVDRVSCDVVTVRGRYPW